MIVGCFNLYAETIIVLIMPLIILGFKVYLSTNVVKTSLIYIKNQKFLCFLFPNMIITEVKYYTQRISLSL